MMSMQSANHF